MNTDGFLGDICPYSCVHQWFTLSVSCPSRLRGVCPGSRVPLVFPFELERFLDCGFGFADCGLEKGTRGDDNQVRGLRVGGQVVAGLGQRAEDVLGVNLVLGAAEEDEAGGMTNT
jgi:hypothetical protein